MRSSGIMIFCEFCTYLNGLGKGRGGWTDRVFFHRMFADIDHAHPEVREDLFRWVEWLGKDSGLKLGGLRMDAIKHYSFRFLKDFLTHVGEKVDKEWFIVGEYWRVDSEFLAKFVEYMDHRLALFDTQLVHNFSIISLLGENGDLRKVFDDALVLWKPDNAVVSRCSFCLLD